MAPLAAVPNTVGRTVSKPLRPLAERAVAPSAVLPSAATSETWMPAALAALIQARTGDSERLPLTAWSRARLDDAYTTFQPVFAGTTVTVTTPSAESTPPKVWRNETARALLPRRGAAVSSLRSVTEPSPKAALCAASQLRAAEPADGALRPAARYPP